MPYRASASRCRVQVTSNVRPANQRVSLFALKTRTPVPACVNAFGHRGDRVCVRNEVQNCRCRQKRCARNSGRTVAGPCSKESGLRGLVSSSIWPSQQPAYGTYPGSWRKTSAQRSEVPSREQQVRGMLQPSVKGIGMQPVARRPNHSVNLTRNSGPHWPSDARYAHNASLVQRGPLPRAGYLKR
jgi:hypothetical protein